MAYDGVYYDHRKKMCKEHPELERLLERARGYVMSPEEKEAQRRSWVVGELMLENPGITREEAVRRYERAKRDLA